jgi:O-antigen/teichoic acid export membrane protein
MPLSYLRKITSKEILTLLDQGVLSLANFFSGVIIGRICSREQFGLYLLGFTIINFLMDVQGSFITTPFTIFAPRLQGVGRRQYLGSTLIHQLTISVGTSVILLLFALTIPSHFFPQDFIPVAWSLVLVIPLILLRDYLRRICFALLEMKSALILDLAVSILQIAGLFILVQQEILSSPAALIVIGISSGVAGVSWIFLHRRLMVLNLKRAKDDLKQNFLSGKWIYASGLLWSLSTYLYPWLLTRYHGTAATGIWAAGLGVVALCNPLYLGMQNFITPKISHAFADGGKISLRKYLFKATALIGGAIIICGLILMFSGNFLLVTFYGDKYVGYQLLISILALNLLLVAVGFSFSRALFVLEKARVDFRINLFSLLLLLSVGIWLIKSYGPVGTALGLMVGNATAAGLRIAAMIFFLKK